MSLMPNFKDIVELVKKGSNLEAQEKIMELREYVIEVQEENFKLKTEVEEIRSNAELSSKLTFTRPFYYMQNDETPYCPKCWENDNKAIHLFEKFGVRFDCPQCKTIFPTKDNDPEQSTRFDRV